MIQVMLAGTSNHLVFWKQSQQHKFQTLENCFSFNTVLIHSKKKMKVEQNAIKTLHYQTFSKLIVAARLILSLLYIVPKLSGEEETQKDYFDGRMRLPR